MRGGKKGKGGGRKFALLFFPPFLLIFPIPISFHSFFPQLHRVPPPFRFLTEPHLRKYCSASPPSHFGAFAIKGKIEKRCFPSFPLPFLISVVFDRPLEKYEEKYIGQCARIAPYHTLFVFRVRNPLKRHFFAWHDPLWSIVRGEREKKGEEECCRRRKNGSSRGLREDSFFSGWGPS